MHTTFSVDAGILLGAGLAIVGVVVSGVANRLQLPTVAVAPETPPEAFAAWAIQQA